MRAKTGANGIRRFATRALLAVGGAIAGTAVAWALTTSAANAETVPTAAVASTDAQQVDVVSKLVAKTDEKLPVVVPAAKAVHKLDETLRAEQEKARAALPDVQVSQAVEQIAARILPQVTRIGQSSTPASERAMDVTFPEIPAPTADAGQSCGTGGLAVHRHVRCQVDGPVGAQRLRCALRAASVPAQQPVPEAARPGPRAGAVLFVQRRFWLCQGQRVRCLRCVRQLSRHLVDERSRAVH